MAHLRRPHVMRQSKISAKRSQKSGSIQNEVSIAERSEVVDKRTVSGHWEGDLISGSNNTHVATLVERKSRFTLLVKVDGKDAATVHKALKKRLRRLPTEVRQRLTWDRGSELSKHPELAIATDLNLYFCDPGSPSVAPMRTPTDCCASTCRRRRISACIRNQTFRTIARELNGRPRKTVGFETPIDVYNQRLL